MSNQLQRRATYRASLKSDDYLIVRHIADFIHRRLPACVGAGTLVLDVGCGEQPLRKAVESLGGQYRGADVTQNRAVTVDYLCPITSMPLSDHSVDTIICTEVMEHVAETERAFHEMARILKPGGTLLLTTPFLYPLHEEPRDFVRLTLYQLTRCADQAGFEVIELCRAGNEIEVMVSLFTRAASWFFKAVSFRPARKLYAVAVIHTQALLNVVAGWADHLIGRYLPQQAYLNTQCVLRRRSSAE